MTYVSLQKINKIPVDNLTWMTILHEWQSYMNESAKIVEKSDNVTHRKHRFSWNVYKMT